MMRVLSAATAVASLNVEPGAYCPAIARSVSGKCASGAVNARYCGVEIPPTKSAGLKVGNDAMARTEPSRGSMTTAAPAGATKFLAVLRS
jgi:hypothetical protein